MKMWLFMLTIFNVISKVRVAFISGQGHTNANLARDKTSSKSWHCLYRIKFAFNFGVSRDDGMMRVSIRKKKKHLPHFARHFFERNCSKGDAAV